MGDEIAIFEQFKFKIGDIVNLRCSPMGKATVLTRSLTESPEGIVRIYNVRGVAFAGDVYEMEIEPVKE